jgi:SAM-dependent methyltransferase
MSTDYYRSKETVAGYIKAAAEVNSKPLIDKLKGYLPTGSALLELGSGPGTDWKILSKTYTVTGSDYSQEFLEHLKAQNPDGEFLQLDAITLETELTFDGIYSNKVLHHLTDDELAQSIAAQLEILKPNGIICHSFWKGEGTDMFNGMYVNYHTESELKTLFEPHFEILLLEQYMEFEEDDSLLLIARTK